MNMDDQFQISVITPFHNVDLDFFSKCADSVINQTLGIENIQWIVVLHNCDEEHIRGARELLEPYPSVELYELNNNAKTPSSPRNYGLQFARGRYIGFLDGDDSYTPDALREAIARNEKHHADFVVFRREFELETSSAIPIKDTVLWDQLYDEILVNPKETDTEKIFSGLCGMTTSKIYLRRFIEDNHLRFDEEVLFAEDYLFIMEIFSCSEKVLFLPQLIGYHYFINSGSLVQSSAKNGETLKSYARGYVKIFEKGLQQGFYMNSTISRLCVTLARFMARNNQLSLEDRIIIRDLLEPYILLTTPMKPGKVYSAKTCEESYSFTREVILHPEKWMDADGKDLLVSDETSDIITNDPMNMLLREILDTCTETDFGTHYRFAELMTVSGYQHCVPLSTYDSYRPLIRLATKIGQTQVLTAEDVFCYVYTAGNTAANKLIPCTARHIMPYVNAFSKIVSGHHTLLLMESSFIKEKYNDDAIANSLYGVIISSFFQQMDPEEDSETSEFSSPRELMFPDRAVDTAYERLFFALADQEIDQIYAPNTWAVLDTFLVLKKRWQALCNDIEKGELSTKTKITPKLREKLSRISAPNPERAAELRQIFSAGFGSDIALRIWPKLSRVVANGGGILQIYTDALRSYIGDIPVVDGLFASAECLLGEPTTQPGVFKLCSTAAFYEFRELSGECRVLQHHEIVPGEEYEPVVTTRAGLYRYCTGDIIQIVSVSGSDIFFSFVRRAEDDSLASGVLYAALKEVSRSFNLALADYSYARSGKDLLILWEAPDEVGEVSALLAADKAALSSRIQEALFCHGVEGIENVTVAFGQPETHLLWRDASREKKLYASDQILPVRSLDDSEKYQYFTTFEL